MNYFELFDLPASPTIDADQLRRRYLSLSRQYHPDFYTLEDEDKQREALEMSTLVNQAYRVLLDQDQRLKYLLDSKGALAEEGQNKVPQDFLLEMMEINEALMELEFENDPLVREKVAALVKELEDRLEEEIAPVLAAYDDEHVTEGELSRLANYYLKRRYLLRIKENLSTFAR